MVERLEREGAGLNLTEQVRDGIAHHSSRAAEPATLEGRIVRVMDRVAYINHDIDDAVRAGLLHERDLPAEPIAVLGRSGSARIDALVHDMVERSERAGDILQGEEAARAMGALRDFMFQRIYLGPEVRAERERIVGWWGRCSSTMWSTPSCCPPHITRTAAGAEPGEAQPDLAQRVTDYMAGMTDRYCIREFTELRVPRAFAV